MMENALPLDHHEISLWKLSPGKRTADGPLTDKEIAQMTRQGVLRGTHYLWLAEQYLIDMSKLGMGYEFDEKLVALSDTTRYMEGLLNSLFKM